MKNLTLFLIAMSFIATTYAASYRHIHRHHCPGCGRRAIYRGPHGVSPWYWYPAYNYGPEYYGSGFGTSVDVPYPEINFGWLI